MHDRRIALKVSGNLRGSGGEKFRCEHLSFDDTLENDGALLRKGSDADSDAPAACRDVGWELMSFQEKIFEDRKKFRKTI